MNRVLKNILTVIITSVLMSSIFTLIMLDSFKEVITKENINKCLGEINIEDLLTSQNVEYDEIINNYVNDTNLSEEDISKIFESDEYSKLVGNYMIDSDMLDGNQYIDIGMLEDIAELSDESDNEIGKDIENDTLLTDKQIEEIFDNLNITYTQGDVNYFKNSITEEVAPEIQNKVINSMGQSQNILSNLKLDGIANVFSNKSTKIYQITIIVCAIALILLNYEKLGFFIPFAICTGVTGGTIRFFAFLLDKIEQIIPNTYTSMVYVFTKPLEEKFLENFNVLIILTVVFVIVHIIMNMLLKETVLGELFSFLKPSKYTEEGYKEMFDEFKFSNGTLADDIDLTQFDNYDEQKDDNFYNTDQLKDITFSNDTYVHNDFK